MVRRIVDKSGCRLEHQESSMKGGIQELMGSAKLVVENYKL